MFWGWYSFGNGSRRGGGCMFLPFLLICGSFFMLDNFNGGWLLPLVVIALFLFVLPNILNQGRQAQVEGYDLENDKPKRDFDDEKPKRDGEYLSLDDGDVLEVIDPPETEKRRLDDEAAL